MAINIAERKAVFESIIAYLSRLYDLYQWDGIRYPVVVFRPDAAQQDDVDSVLGTLLPEYEERASFVFYDADHLRAMQASGRRIENKPVFSFSRLETGPLKLHARLGRYFDMMATCDAMDSELREYFKRGGSLDSASQNLPRRHRLHQTVSPEQALVDGTGRSATIGIATLVVFNHAGTYKAILAQRSARTATDPLFYHVLPAFIFQPSENATAYAAAYASEWRVSRHIYREFLEELFAVPEMDSGEDQPPVYEHPQIQYLLQPGRSSLHLTGVMVNVLTLRPEISALLVIHDPAWVDRLSRNTGRHLAWETAARTMVFAPITTDAQLLASLPDGIGDAFYANITPQGAVALWLGVERARSILV